MFNLSLSAWIPCGGPQKVFTYAGGIRKSSKRNARKALNPKTFPTILVNKFVTEPQGRKSNYSNKLPKKPGIHLKMYTAQIKLRYKKMNNIIFVNLSITNYPF